MRSFYVFLFSAIALLIFGESCRLLNPNRYDENDDYLGFDTSAYYDDDYAMTRYETLPLQSAYEIKADIVHTKLDVRFDWTKKYLYGKEWLTLKPHFYPIDSVVLDAKEMFIHNVALVKGLTITALSYTYPDSMQLHIKLDRIYQANDTFTLYIDYTARPDERSNISGSNAITNNKGLYFINADNKEKDKPRQIWTQGETESNSGWFITIDKPNMKTTLELTITVDTIMKTLSNGILTTSKLNGDGTRSDTWKMDKPFAPYLVMMAVGNFTITRDKWRNIDVNYYTDPEYAPYAKRIFGNTPEMLSFYSQKFGYDYPWPKYSQVVVHDFVSGAMENVTATVHYEGLHQTSRELIDENHEDIIAHELSHHWFGDLVTCKSWGQIPLNESFATYAEALWIQHKYGSYEADKHAEDDLLDYLSESETKQMPLIRYRYADKEDMFDAHSYQKGGYVLRMLHHLVGDDAFTKSLSLYLKSNEYKTVEIDQLRIAFETVTGMDLKWFFDQWFLRPGHPLLQVSKTYNSINQTLQVSMSQSSSLGYSDDINYTIPYRLPMHIDVYTTSGKQRHMVTFLTSDTTFIFSCNEAPLLVNIDADKKLLCVIEESKTPQEYQYQYRNTNTYKDKWQAIHHFAECQLEDTLCASMMLEALNDKYYALRYEALNEIIVQGYLQQKLFPILKKLATEDSSSLVRSGAIYKLGDYNKEQSLPILQAALKDSSYLVMKSALQTLELLDADAALAAAVELIQEKNEEISYVVCKIFSNSRDTTYIPLFIDKMNGMSRNTRFATLLLYGRYLADLNTPINIAWLNPLFEAAEKEELWLMRYAAIAALIDIKTIWLNMSETNTNSDKKRNKANTAEASKHINKNELENQIELINQKLRQLQTKEENSILKMLLTTE